MAKKAHVVLTTLSIKREDGSRKTVDKDEICSCKDRGTAELICRLLLDNNYKELCRKDVNDNERMYILGVE